MVITELEAKEICLECWPFDNWLPKERLVIGTDYVCKARNFHVGKWNGKGFEYTRYKFGHTFQDVEYHWDDGPPYGTAKPLQAV